MCSSLLNNEILNTYFKTAKPVCMRYAINHINTPLKSKTKKRALVQRDVRIGVKSTRSFKSLSLTIKNLASREYKYQVTAYRNTADTLFQANNKLKIRAPPAKKIKIKIEEFGKLDKGMIAVRNSDTIQVMAGRLTYP